MKSRALGPPFTRVRKIAGRPGLFGSYRGRSGRACLCLGARASSAISVRRGCAMCFREKSSDSRLETTPRQLLAAFELVRNAKEDFPDDPDVEALWGDVSVDFTVTTEPEGARRLRQAIRFTGRALGFCWPVPGDRAWSADLEPLQARKRRLRNNAWG